MSMAEYVEQVCGIKLSQYQKDYMDYLDRNPMFEIALPRSRGFISSYELWLLASMLR